MMSDIEQLGQILCPSGAIVLLDSGLSRFWSGPREPELDPFPVACQDLEILGPDARRAGAEFDRQPHPLYLFDIPDVTEMTRLFADFCADKNLQAHCQPMGRRMAHQSRVSISLEDRPLALVQYVGMWAVAATVPSGRALPIRGERMPAGEFEGRWRRFLVDVQEGVAQSEMRLGGVMIDNARLLLGDAGALEQHSLDLPTSWGDGIFPVVAELDRQGQVLRLRVELGDEQSQEIIRDLRSRTLETDVAKYDDAGWHSGGVFPEGVPEEFGGTHIALFLRWCFCKGWAGPVFADRPDLVEKVATGLISATEFLFEYCDGKLVEDMLNVPGNVFARQYYGNDGLYLHDYAEQFGSQMYLAPDHAHDFGKFSQMLQSRFESGVLVAPQAQIKPGELAGWGTTKRVVAPQKPPAKPWWKFW